jgi:putative membrane protein
VASRGTNGIFTFVLTFAVAVLSSAAISSALFLADRKTIATFRRTVAFVVAGELFWLLCVACGLLVGWLGGPSYALTNAFLFGAFACAGFEFLVINGVFTGNTSLSFALAALYPVSTLGIVRLGELVGHLDLIALVFGAASFIIFASFTLMLRRRKTGIGFDALHLFRAFMKTWAARDSADLETAILAHSEDAEVTTKIFRFKTASGDTFILLPGVHPGPFHPVGSYDLPGVISRAFESLGPTMTLHRPGGHERNLATTGETLRYASEVSGFAGTIATSEAGATLRGPLEAKIGKATVSATAFSDDLLMTVSFSPLGSDDLSASLEGEMARPGSEAGFDTYVVDAHNSIDHQQEIPDLSEPGWGELIIRLSHEGEKRFRCAYSHSKEVGFPAGGDLTENGVSLFMVEAGGTKYALVLADANNAVPTLRATVSGALKSSGYQLVEICTSDSHNLAARGLTVARGYRALGEETNINSIAKLTVDLAKRAEPRLSACTYGSGKVVTKVKIFGAKALDEFADITQASSKLGRSYLRFAAASVSVLLLSSLLL